MKKQLLAILLLLCSAIAHGQLQSPTQFFGFEYGTRFIPHHRVLDYVKHLEQQRPKQVKIMPYGESYEHRPLLAVVIASEDNFPKLEEIRTNNLRSIGLLAGTPSAKPTAITWLSYNVHGNEACATSASLPAMYELLSNDKGVLKNSIVVFDPCLNPDGYDRYVNWYNQKVGTSPNPNLSDWQHREPWPGGRYNHYGYDLNRDWAWGTQQETQQRTALYRQWMPHWHADFHEQGINSPYYFPPSAKPYHEDITAFQREMQGVVGDFERKYFDKNAWTYFTRENFDLLYPSYGDTYPTYNGAVGYTLEQGGSGQAGLAALTEVGDTITFKARTLHHHASSWAAMEAASANAEKLVNEFIKYFENGKNNPVGTYKTYIVKTKGEEHKVKPLLAYLDKQGFAYGIAGKATAATNAYSYQDDKTVGLQIEAEDILISAYQPKSTFLKILFEPKTVLEDSLTYDITSWSLPYAYGLKAFALKDKLVPQAYQKKETPMQNVEGKPYAYLLRWRSTEDVRVLAHLLNKKVKAKSAEKAFEMGGQSYEPGTIILLRADNLLLGDKFDAYVQQECKDHAILCTAVSTAYASKGPDLGSNYVNTLKNPRIAIVGGEGTSATGFADVWHYFDQVIKYPVSVMASDALASADFKNFDVLVLPDGGYGRSMGESTLKKLKEWVSSGGRLVALGSANNTLADKEGFELKHKKDEDKKKDGKAEADLKVFGNRERESASEETPGSIFKISVDNTHPLGFGYDKNYHALVLEASDYAYMKEGWNVGYTKKNDHVAGFVGVKAKEKLSESLLFGTQDMGRGKVVYLVNNTLFRGFWEAGKLIFGNAIFQN